LSTAGQELVRTSMVSHDPGDHVRGLAIESLLEDLMSSFKVVVPETYAKINWLELSLCRLFGIFAGPRSN
jgi:hypothetical protein